MADNYGQMQAVTMQTPQESVATLMQHASAAERITLATGAAFASNGATRSRVVVAFSDDEGFLEARESLQLALAHRLPVICVQQTSQKKKNARRTGRKKSHSVLTIPVDQSDVLAVYRVASESIDKARRGVGPTIIQCVQLAREVTDPVEFLELHLRKKNLWSDKLKREVEEAVGPRLSRKVSSRKRG
jgi:TPP-dependent pyruvate/acetoin dehydrogenase alpha subunit